MYDVGTVIAGWHIDEVLHQGSMATTYRVHRPGENEPHALKLLLVRDPAFQERLRRSATVLVGVEHPNLVPVTGLVEHEGQQGIISRYLPSVDLATWLDGQPADLDEAMAVFHELARGLEAAHAHGLVHRNLKPGKVLVDEDGHAHLHDFMLGKVMTVDPGAAVTQMGTTFGTPQYMPPEQFRGAALVDERADLFALGCLLFELLTGRRAFDGKGLMDIYEKVLDGERPALTELRPEAPEALDRLITDLTRPEVDDRIPSATALLERLATDPGLTPWADPRATPAPPPAPEPEPEAAPAPTPSLHDGPVLDPDMPQSGVPSIIDFNHFDDASEESDPQPVAGGGLRIDADQLEKLRPPPSAPAPAPEPAPAPPMPAPLSQQATAPAPPPRAPASPVPLPIERPPQPEQPSGLRVAALLFAVFVVAIVLGMLMAQQLL